jgi:hypothetical protein
MERKLRNVETLDTIASGDEFELPLTTDIEEQ